MSFHMGDVVVANFNDVVFDDRPKWSDGSCTGIIVGGATNLLFDWAVLFEEGINETIQIDVTEAEIKLLEGRKSMKTKRRTAQQKRYIRDTALWFGDDHAYIIVNRTKPHIYSNLTNASLSRLMRLIDSKCRWSSPNIDFSIYLG